MTDGQSFKWIKNMNKKRIVKNPDVRRAEILNVSEKLFKKEGYAKTSVESIIKNVGIAKGTFYYYFKTKEEILNALVEKISTDMQIYFKSIIEADNLAAIEKLKLILRGPQKKKITSSNALKIIHQPENRELQEKLNIETLKVIPPHIFRVFEKGKAEGVFTKAPSVEIIQIVLAGSQFVLDSGLFSWPPKKRKVFLNELQTLFELMVDVKPGKLNFISQE
jgi:AcrR family transcriptional regulator